MAMILTKTHMHKQYFECVTSSGGCAISLCHFHRLFKAFFKHVKFPKFTRLGTCSLCHTINDSIGKRKMGPVERAGLKQDKMEHMKVVDGE
jgi:hypothetical protein